MPAGNGPPSVEHVVVLMLENRSFDHMLGFL
jgi:phospholipase C